MLRFAVLTALGLSSSLASAYTITASGEAPIIYYGEEGLELPVEGLASFSLLDSKVVGFSFTWDGMTWNSAVCNCLAPYGILEEIDLLFGAGELRWNFLEGLFTFSLEAGPWDIQAASEEGHGTERQATGAFRSFSHSVEVPESSSGSLLLLGLLGLFFTTRRHA